MVYVHNMIVVVFWSVFSNQSLVFLSMKKTFLYNGGCGPNGSDFSKWKAHTRIFHRNGLLLS